MKFIFLIFYKTPLAMAVESDNKDMVEVLLQSKNIDINEIFILNQQFFFNIVLNILVFQIKFYNLLF